MTMRLRIFTGIISILLFASFAHSDPLKDAVDSLFARAETESLKMELPLLGADAIPYIFEYTGISGKPEEKLAKDVIVSFGDDAIPEMLSQLRTENWVRMWVASDILIEIGNPLPLEEAILGEKSEKVVCHLLYILEKIGKPSSLHIFRRFAASKNETVASKAVSALGTLGDAGDIKLVLKAAKSGSFRICRGAYSALGKFARRDAVPPELVGESVLCLVSGLRKKHYIERDVAVEALTAFGDDAIMYLEKYLNERNFYVRYNIVRVLEQIGTSEAFEVLTSLSEDRDWGVRWAVVEACTAGSFPNGELLLKKMLSVERNRLLRTRLSTLLTGGIR